MQDLLTYDRPIGGNSLHIVEFRPLERLHDEALMSVGGKARFYCFAAE